MSRGKGRVSYRDAIHWIAANDAPGDKPTIRQYQTFLTVLLVADVWGKPSLDVASDVLRKRIKLEKQNRNG